MKHLTRDDLVEYLTAVGKTYAGTGRILLIGATSHVWEGHLRHTPEIELTVDDGSTRDSSGQCSEFESVCQRLADERGFALILDSPADYIPLPAGHDDRMLAATNPPIAFDKRITLLHFDPYSVAFRFIARGDEPDYHVALRSLACGWIDDQEMDDMVDWFLPMLPKETIQQDPAEFRRKYKGLQQLRKAAAPGVIHRFSPV